mgnify:CR=1 FL=1
MPDGHKILIVDDDPDQVDSTRLILESNGYDVVVAYDARQAFETALAEKPDLIVLDIMMPDGTEGFQLVSRLRNELPEEQANVPIIIVSAIHDYTTLRLYPDQSDTTYAPGEYLDAQGFIDKPAEPRQLLGKVAELLRKP